MTDLDNIWQTLKDVMDPDLNVSIVDLGMVHDLDFHDGVVSFTLALTTMACPMRRRMEDDARQRLLDLEQVREVIISMREMTPEEKQKIMGPQQQLGSAEAYNSIKYVIAVVSGKGGVGKSSVSALLAIALRRRGYQVGILDADITGPSIPKMLLQDNVRPVGSPVGILPVQSKSGIEVMSINLLLPDTTQAVIWRGPMISGAIRQFWGDVVWGALDYLIIDLPPGTSDASLTVMQTLPLNGIVLVTSPQTLAGMVVRKAASMADQLGVPLVGIIENMSYVKCPDCGKSIEVFGASSAAELATTMHVPLLGRLPLNPSIAILGDSGRLEEYEDGDFETIVDRLLLLVPEEACTPLVNRT